MINFLLGWLLLALVMFIGVPKGIFVSDIKSNSLAAYSGFQKGDLITGFNSAEEFNNYLLTNLSKEVSFKIKRNGDVKEIKVVLPLQKTENKELLGIYYGETGVDKSGLWGSITNGFLTSCQLVWGYLKGYLYLFGRLFTDISVFQDLMSPVGLFAMGSLVSKAGFVYFLQLLAYLSINLIVFNFFPFPMLDGGWFLLILIEKIKGSPVSQKTEMIVNGIGFVIIFSLLLATTIKDLINLF